MYTGIIIMMIGVGEETSVWCAEDTVISVLKIILAAIAIMWRFESRNLPPSTVPVDVLFFSEVWDSTSFTCFIRQMLLKLLIWRPECGANFGVSRNHNEALIVGQFWLVKDNSTPWRFENKLHGMKMVTLCACFGEKLQQFLWWRGWWRVDDTRNRLMLF